jgi:DNA-binding IclR family transcriptional regulator
MDLQEVRRHFEQVKLISFTKQTITNIDLLIQHLEQVRVQGYALDISEHEVDVQCVATPIRGIEGKVVAAISVSGPGSRMNLQDDRQDLIEITRKTADKISSQLGYFHSR